MDFHFYLIVVELALTCCIMSALQSSRDAVGCLSSFTSRNERRSVLTFAPLCSSFISWSASS